MEQRPEDIAKKYVTNADELAKQTFGIEETMRLLECADFTAEHERLAWLYGLANNRHRNKRKVNTVCFVCDIPYETRDAYAWCYACEQDGIVSLQRYVSKKMEDGECTGNLNLLTDVDGMTGDALKRFGESVAEMFEEERDEVVDDIYAVMKAYGSVAELQRDVWDDVLPWLVGSKVVQVCKVHCPHGHLKDIAKT